MFAPYAEDYHIYVFDVPEELSRAVNVHVYSEDYYSANEEAFHGLESSATADGVTRLHNLK